MSSEFRSILHPTDFSDLSSEALAHALRIALAAKGRLTLLHIARHGDDDEEVAFPHVRRRLAQWGLIDEDASPSDVATKLGLCVSKIRIEGQDPAKDILGFVNEHHNDLLVLATHGRDGLQHWLKGSVAEAVFQQAAIPTLFVAPTSRGFISQVTGDISLRRVLVPVDHSPTPDQAIELVRSLGYLLGSSRVDLHLLHVGRSAPVMDVGPSHSDRLPPVILRSGNVVQTILDVAVEFDIDLIGMPTAGHHGVLDALRGSTTERVLRHSPCPLLAIGVGRSR